MTDVEILTFFLHSGGRERYGLEIAKEAGIKSGTLYPALARLERDGLLESRWEEADPAEEGRPRRRMYTLTAPGITAANEARRELFDRLSFGTLPPLGALA